MRPPRHPVLVGLAALVVVVVVAELVARSLAPNLPEPDRWGDEARAVKVAQMDHLAATPPGCVDLVVAGDSMARDGFVPVAFSDADPAGRRGYNASLDAAGPALLGPWLTDQVLPRLDPATVVVALSSIDLNRNGPAAEESVAAYTSSLEGRRDVLGRLDRWASDWSALVEHRRSLRQPGVVLDSVRGEGEASPPALDDAGRPVMPGVLGPNGEGLSRRDLRYRGPGASAAFTSDQLLGDFSLGADPAAAVTDLVEDLQAHDVDVALLVLPVTDGFADLHPGGRADLEASHRAVLDAAEATGVPVVDLLDAGWPDEDFADTHHLNGRGADRLSAELPDLLAAAGVPVARCGPPS